MNKKFITILILGSSLLVNAAKGPADFFDMMITNWRKEANAQKKKDLGVAVEEVFYTLSSDDKDERKGDIAELKGIAESAVVMVRPATGVGATISEQDLKDKYGDLGKALAEAKTPADKADLLVGLFKENGFKVEGKSIAEPAGLAAVKAAENVKKGIKNDLIAAIQSIK